MSNIKINKNFFDRIKDNFIQQADEVKFAREVSFALQAIQCNAYIAKVAHNAPESVLKAVLNISQTGLTLNPIQKLAYLIPMGNEIVLMPSYKGLTKLLTDGGAVQNIEAHIVYEGDLFEVELGTNPNVLHKRKFQSNTILGCYAIASLNRNKVVEFMSLEDLYKIREMSEQFKSYVKRGKKGSCMWVDHEPQMIRKTVIKRITNYLPRSIQYDTAVELDNQQYGITGDQKFKINMMLEQLPVPVEVVDHICLTLNSMTRIEASKTIEELKQYRPDSYYQTDIGKRVDAAVDRENN